MFNYRRRFMPRMGLNLIWRLHFPCIFGVIYSLFLIVIVTYVFISGPETRPDIGFIPKEQFVDRDHQKVRHNERATHKILHVDEELKWHTNASRVLRGIQKALPKPHVQPTEAYNNCCDSLERPIAGSMDTDTWSPVDSGSRSQFVFSAYLDTRTIPHSIRVIGVSSGSRGNFFCQIWYRERSTPHVTSAGQHIVPETHGFKYGAALYTCSTLTTGTPYAVSITSSKCGTPTHWLSVSTTRNENKFTFTVCVSPMNFNYDDIHSFVEMMEMNKILGADRVVLYNHTTGWRINRYIRKYVSEGYADLVPWRIPLAVNVRPPDPEVNPEIHYFGQLAALNDCLYRYMHQTEYIIFTDLDEFIIPRVNTTWSEMLLDMNPPIQRTHGAYLFRNAFFRIDWPDDTTYGHSLDVKFQLRTQLKLSREERVWAYYSRTKCMVRSSTVVMTGIHFMFQFVNNTITHFEVPKKFALLHHYRDWGDDDGLPERVFDPYMLKYRNKLIQNVMKRYDLVS